MGCCQILCLANQNALERGRNLEGAKSMFILSHLSTVDYTAKCHKNEYRKGDGHDHDFSQWDGKAICTAPPWNTLTNSGDPS